MIGHVGFWATVVYGSGIFMTVSPGERHNYLAIRLSRYRREDPYITESQSRATEEPWIGADKPSLEAACDESFEVEVPGYDARKNLLAKDPLAAANAFFIQIRVLLATLLGIRMCPQCPHCCEGKDPCMDSFGSNAELMGGFAGRADAICGAVECQRVSGALHYHFWVFIQRLHQYCTLQEIAELIKNALVSVKDWKDFLANLCCEHYPDEKAAD